MKRRKVLAFGICLMLLTSNLSQVFAESWGEKQKEPVPKNGLELALPERPIGGLAEPEVIYVEEDEAPEDVVISDEHYSARYEHDWDIYSSRYVYNQLNDAEKALWDSLDAECRRLLDSSEDLTDEYTQYVYGDASQISDISTLARLFYYENPQYFFLQSGWKIRGDRIAFKVYDYFQSGSNRAAAKAEIQTLLNSWMRQINACDTDFAKAIKIQELIVDKVEYCDDYVAGRIDEQDAFSQSAYSTFCKDETVCAGYTKAFQWLCNAAGIDAMGVTSEGHAWNKVRLNDSWYNIDCTWADIRGAGVTYKYAFQNDAYWATVDNRTLENHVQESYWEGYVPVCTLSVPLADGRLPVPDATDGSYYLIKVLDGEPHVPTVTVATPKIRSEANGSVYEITITDDTAQAVIYYTTDGSAPSEAFSKSKRYRGSFEVSDYTKVRAIAVKDTCKDSEIAATQPPHVHTWDNGVITRRPTKEATGIRTYTCTECGATQTAVIPKLDESVNVEGQISIKADGESLAGLSLKIFDGDTELPVADVDAEGNFTISGLPDGTYTMKLAKKNYATRNCVFTVTGGEAGAVEAELHKLGDIDGDGYANIMDLERICNHIRGTARLTGYEIACADIDGGYDENVNARDLDRLCNHIRNVASLWE